MERFLMHPRDPSKPSPADIIHANPEELARELIRLQHTDAMYATLCRLQRDHPQITDQHILCAALLSREEILELLHAEVRDRPPEPIVVGDVPFFPISSERVPKTEEALLEGMADLKPALNKIIATASGSRPIPDGEVTWERLGEGLRDWFSRHATPVERDDDEE